MGKGDQNQDNITRSEASLVRFFSKWLGILLSKDKSPRGIWGPAVICDLCCFPSLQSPLLWLVLCFPLLSCGLRRAQRCCWVTSRDTERNRKTAMFRESSYVEFGTSLGGQSYWRHLPAAWTFQANVTQIHLRSFLSQMPEHVLWENSKGSWLIHMGICSVIEKNRGGLLMKLQAWGWIAG